MPTLWNDRFAWSSEIPLTYSDLNPVALSRGTDTGGGLYNDAVTPSRLWTYESTNGIWWGREEGQRGVYFRMNYQDPALEQGRLQLAHFNGLWPSSGRLLTGLWVQQSHTMDFNPLIDTRATDPTIYLSTFGNTGQPRAQVYNASGTLIFDQTESGFPWALSGDWYFLGAMVDDDAKTSRMFAVHEDGSTWLAPERTFTGTPNLTSTANVDIFSLRHANYWERGFFDEVLIAHPGAGFSLTGFVEDMGLSIYADGSEKPGNWSALSVTEEGVTANSTTTLSTGAEALEWPATPTFDAPAGATYFLSTDDGETWTSPSTLPSTFDGLVRWEIPMTSGATFDGIESTFPDAPDEVVTPADPVHDAEANTVVVTPQTGVVWSQIGEIEIPEETDLVITATPASGYTFPEGFEPSWTFTYTWPDPPTLGPIDDVMLLQAENTSRELVYTGEVEPLSWSVSAPSLVSVALDEGILSISSGFETGTGSVTVTLTDGRGRSVSRSFFVEVESIPYEPGEPPIYPHAPIVLWDDDGPEAVLIDPLKAIVTKELNGEETFEFTIPSTHKHAHLIFNERRVEAAGEIYWVRRATSERQGRRVDLKVYAEARFYELATATSIDVQEFNQVLPGSVMALALEGTGWTIGTVNVGTRRSYTLDSNTNPLALLRLMQSNHGGDLLFDNVNRTVSLVTTSGRDNGVGFFYSRGLADAKRVIDTSSLVNRIFARNEDGLTIASVNGGVPYVEDFGFTEELKVATYNFKAGTTPQTMLSTTNATLARRSQPDVSYECTVADLSATTESPLDRFDVGDRVTVSDPDLGLNDTQRIVELNYNLIQPWATQITLSSKLRETGSTENEADILQTGSTVSTFDLVPFNLLLNARFDNELAHWANSGVTVVDSTSGTGDYAVRFAGTGTRWIEQTVTPDNRSAYALSFDVTQRGGPEGWEPDVTVEAEITYEDGTSEIIELDLSGRFNAGEEES